MTASLPLTPFPETGAYSCKQWAEFYGVTPETLTDWVSDHEVPVFGPSDRNFHIDAEDMRAGFPKRIIKKKTGSKRKKKTRATGLNSATHLRIAQDAL